ncbi:MAG: hypothetical protein U1C46_02310 [Bacteroidales bacterium]|nr:hypothetical protein [Bacteroidales bacterium]MDZ4203629.1 hypothetical protein [Bacteroidales bacterium]
MQKLLTLFFSCLIIGFICFAIGSYAQTGRGETEVLVFIMRDSLELSPSEKGRVGLQQAIVKSKRLQGVLTDSKMIGIAKAF